MRTIARRTLREFWTRHATAEQPLRAWYAEAKAAEWASPQVVRDRYPSASILGGNRVVFKISCNNYRLIAKINYAFAIVYIRFVGTHAEYDRIDAETV